MSSTLQTTIELAETPLVCSQSISVSPQGAQIPFEPVSLPAWSYGSSTAAKIPRSSLGLMLSSSQQVLIPSPEVLQNFLCPLSLQLEYKILSYRQKLGASLNAGANHPLLVVTGPRFVSNATQIRSCAQWIGHMLGKLPQVSSLVPKEVAAIFNAPAPKNLMLAMRANFSGSQSYGGSSYEILHGIPHCRALLDQICQVCPVAGEVSSTISPQYLSDYYCLGLVSSTLVESQLHRELASGLSYSVGFGTSDSHLPFDKDMYKHRLQSGLDAMYAAGQQHQFLSVTKLGTVAVVGTTGNDETFIVLEVNLQMSYADLCECIEMIYSKSMVKLAGPRVLLDVGALGDDFEQKLSTVKQLLQQYRTRILGVTVDSGDFYCPHFTSSDHTLHADVSYTLFVNANRFIQELDTL